RPPGAAAQAEADRRGVGDRAVPVVARPAPEREGAEARGRVHQVVRERPHGRGPGPDVGPAQQQGLPAGALSHIARPLGRVLEDRRQAGGYMTDNAGRHMTITIRPYRPDDLDAIKRLTVDSFAGVTPE